MKECVQWLRETVNHQIKEKHRQKKERMAEMEKAQAFRVEVTLWIVVAAALLLFISNLGFGGAVGKTVSGFLFGMFGLMAYVLPVLLLVGSFFAVSNRGNKLAAVKLIAAIVFLVFLCTFMGLAMNGNDRIHPLDAYTYCAERHTGGGIIGGCLAYYMCQAFGLIGSFIIDIIVLIVCMVLITERSALRGMQKGGKRSMNPQRKAMKSIGNTGNTVHRSGKNAAWIIKCPEYPSIHGLKKKAKK